MTDGEQPDQSSLRAALEAAILHHDRVGAVRLAHDAIDDGSTSIESLYNVLSEMLVDIGDRWQRGTVEVWQEHLASGIVRSIVESTALTLDMAAPKTREATVILASPTEEYHDLGLRMLSDRFVLAGWRAHFLGADVPLPQLVEAVQTLRPDAVALSASTHYHRVTVGRYVSELSESFPHLSVWVGGPAFALDQEGWPPGMILDPRHIPAPGHG